MTTEDSGQSATIKGNRSDSLNRWETHGNVSYNAIRRFHISERGRPIGNKPLLLMF